ncbi:MAG: NAD-dependent epimerase/dehydratase family protein [Candidatus Thermoplasmatota archaeon]|jgi:UDP-glucose 4-epimerase
MRVLVTGSRGHLASWVLDTIPAGAHVVGLDIKNGPEEDVRGKHAAAMAADADVILHLAALIDVAASVRDPETTRSVNVEGTRNLLESVRPGSLFIFVSSAAVYGDAGLRPIGESVALQPSSPYGESKADGERLVADMAKTRGFRAVVVRPFNLYSGRQDPANPYSGVITRFMRACLNEQPIMIHGDGQQTRDFIHASDVASFLWVCARDPRATGQTFNVGSGDGITILDLALMVQQVALVEVPIEHGPARDGDIRHSQADVTRALSLGWRPRVPLREGLGETLKGLKDRLS